MAAAQVNGGDQQHDSVLDRKEIAEQARANGGGALGMKLHATKIVPAYGRTERPAVVAGGERVGALGGGEAVHEVHMRTASDAPEQRVIAHGVELVPAHVRH